MILNLLAFSVFFILLVIGSCAVWTDLFFTQEKEELTLGFFLISSGIFLLVLAAVINGIPEVPPRIATVKDLQKMETELSNRISESRPLQGSPEH